MKENEMQIPTIDCMEGDPRSEAGFRAAIEAGIAKPLEDFENSSSTNEMQPGYEIEIQAENNS